LVAELASLLGRHGYLPHGYCITWRPELLWSMVVSDGLIALAYFSIPLALWRFVHLRRDVPLKGIVTLFCLFIFACGVTHVMDVWTVWQPDYGWQALSKMVTAAVSIGTAIVLWPLLSKAVAIPTITQLKTVISSLEAEVAQRRSTEDNLANAQEALMITLASIGAGFIATDRAGLITQMNRTAEEATGWRLSEALGQPYWSVVRRADRLPDQGRLNPVDAMIDNGGTIERVHYVDLVARDGRHTPVELRASLAYAQDGQVRGLISVFRDMTRLYQAQEESNRLAAIVESSNDAIVGKTLDGLITSWNHGAQMIFGYTPEEAIGQPVQMLIPADRRHEEMRILTRLEAGRRVPAFDTIRLRKDGSTVPVSVTISPILDVQGRVVGASKIARDITEHKRVEDLRVKGVQLEAENRQIQEASRLKSEFLANMSHELRTPLNAIIGFADLMHSGAVPVESPKHQEFLGYIGTSGRHLLQLINDVLDLSKIEAGKVEFYPEPLLLPALVKEVTDILQASASKQGLRIEVHIDPEVAQLTLDPARLKQVLYNYLSNAIKFTPSGGLITLRALPDGPEHVRIEVEDTGIGIAPADMRKLFNEFQQLDSSYTKRHAGTGLGLALTRKLVQGQGGSVGVRSTPGVGSVFHLVLPRRPLARGDTNAAHRVLVIHAEADEQRRIKGALSDAGFEVDAAATGEQALNCAVRHPYDAITLELVLPDRPGLDVLGTIRERGPSSETPVVAVTLQTQPGSVAGFQITDVLFKPIQASQVRTALHQIGLTQASRARMLVIDDDPVALDLMHATLKTFGLDVVCIDNGRQALDEIDLHQPDAIVLDLMMPELDGFAVLDALRGMPDWRDIPVFIWTSMSLSDEEYTLLARSAHAILNKGGGTLDTVLDDLRHWQPSDKAAKARDET
jgi:PAS domain S-box-containing protein